MFTLAQMKRTERREAFWGMVAEKLKSAGLEDVTEEQRQQNLEQNVDQFLSERQSDAR